MDTQIGIQDAYSYATWPMFLMVGIIVSFLLIVVIGGIGSVSGSCIGSFLFIACSEWWLRFLDNTLVIGGFTVPLFKNGFRMAVVSVIIMIVVLFFRKGIMGDKELPNLLRKRTKSEKKEGGAK